MQASMVTQQWRTVVDSPSLAKIDQASMAMASTNPSRGLRCGSSNSEVAVSFGHVHGGTATQSARNSAYHSDEMVVGDGSPSLVMVLGFKTMRTPRA